MSRFLILINISWYRLKTLLFQISEDMKLMKMVTVRFIRGMMTKAMQNMDYL